MTGRSSWLLVLVGAVAGSPISTEALAAEAPAGPPRAAASQAPVPSAGDLRLPLKRGSVRFAVIGDTGTGGAEQYRIAGVLSAWRARFPYDFVLMMGDNLYGSERPRDYEGKFEKPYRALLDANVKFYAALGNHDESNQVHYEHFNMGGKRFYTFKAGAARAEPPAAGAAKTAPADPGGSGGVRFFALDSNYLEPDQLEWLEKELAASGSDWKICFFHHPLYSSGEAHGPAVEWREALEPLLVKHGVDVVFTGHEHFYERIKPQKGIAYFIAGASAKLRRGDVRKTDLTAKAFDQGYSFMLVEIAGDEMHFQTISDDGKTVDSGVVRKREAAKADTGGD
jgi:hypothetical protein